MKLAQAYNLKRHSYKKYNYGGDSAQEEKEGVNGAQMIAGLTPLATGFIDALSPGNEYGRQRTGTVAAKGLLNGAAAGTPFGLPGVLIGGALGGLTGLISGNRAKKEEKKALYQQSIQQKIAENNRMGAQLAANPSLYQGYYDAQYYANGGTLPNTTMQQPIVGGQTTQQSSDGVSIIGNTHQQGGVKFPAMGVEVENGETIKDNYVFSKTLGFADLHKPIMALKGKIEKKPFTPDRINAIKLLNARENKLMLSQEFLKQKFGLN